MIRRAWITEKAGDLQKFRKYIFIVRPNATKPAIKAAVENSYKVKVTDVHILTVKGPVTRRGGRYAKEPDMKKAIVTLTEGNTIDLMPA
ncbi:50S ribosomal protein L23 [Candidatus Wolfebacteria bacterium]|nr:50S ribosomal protein L23 [Candidatus Wolfebacteria bacterium]